MGLYGATSIASASFVSFASSLESRSLIELGARGNDHNCALYDNGLVYCWGGNVEGQLGLNKVTGHKIGLTNTDMANLVAINFGHTFKVTHVATMKGVSCAVFTHGNSIFKEGSDLCIFKTICT